MATRSFGEARPVAVLLRHSVWFDAVNLPLFILYEDGRVIVPAGLQRGMPLAYRTARIDSRDPDAALARLGIGPDFFRLQSSYDFRPNVTDRETIFLLVWRGDSLTRVAVRAGIGGDGRLAASVPEAFRAAYEGLTTFRPSGAADWHPDTVEVSAWPYEYAPDNPPLEWPGAWPSLTSPGSLKRADQFVDTIWTIPLAYEHVTELERLLERRGARQAIRISGRKLAVDYRLRFPGEERWRRLLGRLET